MPYTFPVLITKDLCAGYPGMTTAIKGVDLSIEPGRVWAVAGQSGAGKTTLVKVLRGELSHSAGTVHIQGQIQTTRELRSFSDLGIRTVGFRRQIGGKATVADSLQLENLPTRFGIIDPRERTKRAASVLSMFGLGGIDPGQLIATLTAGQQMLVELAGAMTKTTSLLVLDDVTGAMTDAEAQILYDQLSRLRYAGLAVLYLTTDAQEAVDIGDVVSALREGTLVSAHAADEVFANQIIGEMAGRVMPKRRNGKRVVGPETVLRVEGLSLDHCLYSASFKLKFGEVFGLLGLRGAGQSEIVQAICGAIPTKEGAIFVRGSTVPLRFSSIEQSAAQGIGYLPDPLGASSDPNEKNVVLFSGRPMRLLNASNPQKAALASCLRAGAKVLALDNPTRGLNIACRIEMRQAILELADQGMSMVAASTDMDDLMETCDRIGIVADGRIIRILERIEYVPDRIEKLLRTGKS